MKKFISFLLVCALLCGLVPAVMAVGAAADDQTTTPPENGGLKLNKTAEYDAENDKYWITLEAYATGASTTINTAAPVDFVLVLDQSGSMAEKMSTNNYNPYTGNERKNSNLYTKRHNNDNNKNNQNLHYKDGNTYYPVYVTKGQTNTYTPLPATTTNTEYNDYSRRDNLYADASGTIKVDVDWEVDWGIKYTYKFGGTTLTSKGRYDVPDFVSNGTYRFYVQSTVNTYTYTYVKNNQTYTIGTSTGDDALFEAATLYSYTEDTSTTRLESMMTAANNFAATVHQKAVEDKLDHRVAVVGFASNVDIYKNTEVLTGVTVETGNKINDNGPSTGMSYYYFPKYYNYRGTQYGKNGIDTAYKNALQHMNTDAGYKNVTDAISYLTAYGGTQTDHGLAMAKGIYDKNPIQPGENRKRVVILLTDGIPTGNSSSYSSSTYSNAQTIADQLKGTSYNAIIYTIGIFDGANAEKAGSVGDKSSDADKGNYVCQQLSSNNGTPPKAGEDSYYLSAGTQESLNKIFLKIAGELKTNTSASTELGTSTTIQDVVAPQFDLPTGFVAGQVELKTYACTGVDASGNPTFSNTPNKTDAGVDDAMGATATIGTDGKLNVTGFDYKENWCGQATDASGNKTARGNKLVIRFPLVVKEGFLGGNDVYTNTEAKVYTHPEDAAVGEDGVGTFPRPQVNVPIQKVTVTATDKNVYLLGSLTAEQIKSGTTATCGSVNLDLSAENYGLESWQTEYVNINVTYIDAEGNTVIDLNNLEADTTYTVTVTVSPKKETPTSTQGTAAETQTGTATGKINVFTPTLTFKDSQVWYGDIAPTNPGDYNTNNYESDQTVWKHGTEIADEEKMGTAPNLNLTYKPDGDGVKDGKIAVKTDIPVDVTVKIGTTDVTDKTGFVHTKCNGETSDPTNGKFWLHVNTCKLTITKDAGKDTTIGEDEYFVFTVYKDGEEYTHVTIKGTDSVTIKELPVGYYLIKEDMDVAWRYDSTISNGVELFSLNSAGTFTCTNTIEDNKWLNDFTRVINTYGEHEGKMG